MNCYIKGFALIQQQRDQSKNFIMQEILDEPMSGAINNAFRSIDTNKIFQQHPWFHVYIQHYQGDSILNDNRDQNQTIYGALVVHQEITQDLAQALLRNLMKLVPGQDLEPNFRETPKGMEIIINLVKWNDSNKQEIDDREMRFIPYNCCLGVIAGISLFFSLAVFGVLIVLKQ